MMNWNWTLVGIHRFFFILATCCILTDVLRVENDMKQQDTIGLALFSICLSKVIIDVLYRCIADVKIRLERHTNFFNVKPFN